MSDHLDDDLNNDSDSCEQSYIVWEPIPLTLELPLPPQNNFFKTPDTKAKSSVIEIDMN